MEAASHAATWTKGRYKLDERGIETNGARVDAPSMTNFPEWGTFSRARVAFASTTALATVVGVSVALAGQAGVSTVAGTGSEGGTGDGGAATLARLHEPGDVAMLPGGGFLIADTKNDSIREVSAERHDHHGRRHRRPRLRPATAGRPTRPSSTSPAAWPPCRAAAS